MESIKVAINHMHYVVFTKLFYKKTFTKKFPVAFIPKQIKESIQSKEYRLIRPWFSILRTIENWLEDRSMKPH